MDKIGEERPALACVGPLSLAGLMYSRQPGVPTKKGRWDAELPISNEMFAEGESQVSFGTDEVHQKSLYHYAPTLRQIRDT